jgi:hypothetical protein
MASLIPTCGVFALVSLVALCVLPAATALCVGLAVAFLFGCAVS